MTYFKNIKNLFLTAVACIAILSACNKGLEDIAGNPPFGPTTPSAAKGLADTIKAIPNYSLYSAIVTKSGLAATLNNKSATYTAFVPTNAALKQLISALTGGALPVGAPDANFIAFINSANFPVANAAGIVSYNVIPQAVPSASLPTTFPNLQYPTLINPAPQLSALLRLTTFPSNRNGFYLNNVPLTKVDIMAGNGIIHELAAVVLPPTKYLWDTINVSTNLRYLKAAIQRADSGVATASTLQAALLNIGANLTVFAPTDAAFQTTLTGLIYQTLLAQGLPAATALATAQALAASPTVFTNPALAKALTPQTVKGIVVYHIMGVRAFTNNFPTVQSNFPTLLNTAIAAHPGIGLKVTFTGPFVSAATVKGIANMTASNILINPTPAPNGSSDQNYLNGSLHFIDQVLLPQ